MKICVLTQPVSRYVERFQTFANFSVLKNLLIFVHKIKIDIYFIVLHRILGNFTVSRIVRRNVESSTVCYLLFFSLCSRYRPHTLDVCRLIADS